MDRALSLHIGVNQPRLSSFGDRLTHSEANAWRMAGLAHQAGYRSIRVLLGEQATRQAVHEALAGAASTLGKGDTLFVSFSGHGMQKRELVSDLMQDERDGLDEAWCLPDFELVDDQLVAYWRLFQPDVRILMVTESCYGGGMGRYGNKGPAPHGGVAGRRRPERVDPPVVYRGEESRIKKAPADTLGIRASLLLIAACGENQLAQDGLFSCKLFKVWNDGAFDGTFSDLYQEVHDLVIADPSGQDPRMLMVGAPNTAFQDEPAFHLRRRPPGSSQAYR